MGNVLPVEVMQAGSHLPEPKLGLLLRHNTVPRNKVQEVTIVGVAHEYEHSWTALQYTVHL
ncbi:hypothetical protein WH47_00168 [Habropoda laboriosa]|uniref:Uncharacterized protein n=1 Tax=Habropoda laboriosa TaxID=597456 RepID=A0A0L7R1B8_9HYME|nr:hypothetical protein WH47_00168 [Habropoda laboriosa]